MSAWHRGSRTTPAGGVGHFPPQRPGYYGDSYGFRNPSTSMSPVDSYGYFNDRMQPEQRPIEMIAEPPALQPRPVQVATGSQVVFKVNHAKSLPAGIQNILVSASRVGNLSAADGFKLRAYYEKLTDSVKITFYQHMVKCLGVGDADLIADRPSLIPSKGSGVGKQQAVARATVESRMPIAEGPSRTSNSADNDDDDNDSLDSVDMDMTSATARSRNDSSSRPQMPLIVPTKLHVIDRTTKAQERRRRQSRATPKVKRDNVMDYTKDELPGVKPGSDGKLTFNMDTVRWIRQMLYILYRSGKGGDKGADQFLKHMGDFFGPDIVKQVNLGSQMWRLKQAEETAAKDVVVPATPEEAAKLDEIHRLKRFMHHLKLETVVGLSGNETRCGFTPETVAWIRDTVLSMLLVQMNPDKFLKRIGGMFGMPAMDVAWADKPFAVAMRRLTPGMPAEEKPVMLLKLAAAAYRKAFATVLPGTDPDAAEEEEANDDGDKKQPLLQTTMRAGRSAQWNLPAPPIPRPLLSPAHPRPPIAYDFAPVGPAEYGIYNPSPTAFGRRPLPPPPPYNYDYYSPVNAEPAPLLPNSFASEFHFRPRTASNSRHQPYPRGGIRPAGRAHVQRGRGGRAL